MSVFFSETQSLITDQGASVIQASGPTYNGNSLGNVATGGSYLTANVGTTLSTPIQVTVGGLEVASNGVSGVAVRIVNSQTSPTVTCNTTNNGGYADPGSVLSAALGIANCYPKFNGSGNGSFYVTIGGIPGTGIATAVSLQAFGPFNFTSFPGAPASVQIISGNNQVGTSGQALNPLVAELEDAQGNPVQNQTMQWSVLPTGAVALQNSPLVTDNNGQVSIVATLDSLAQSGVQVTCALASNPSIKATFQLTLAGAVNTVSKVSGDLQSAQINTNFASPLVIQVNGSSGPVAGYPVQFLVNGTVTLPGGSTAVTNAAGQASTTVKAGSLAGTATVTAVAGTSNAVFTLTITTTSTAPPPNGMTIVSGNNQTAVVGATFGQSLVVQVNNVNGPLPGYVVNFSTTGPISLSTAAATTNSSGQASVTVSAGNSSGAGTVTASVTGYSQVFNLTVAPPGPAITASSFLNAASRQVGYLSPCGLAILTASGLTPDGTSDLSLAPVFGRFPHTLHGLSVTFGGIPAPIISVAMGATNPEVTLQVPCEVTPASSVPVVVNVNGGGTASVNIPILTVSPGIFQTTMTDGVLRAVVVRSDGSFADIGGSTAYDPNNPARLSENVRIYVTGVGATTPTVASDNIQDPNADLVGTYAQVAGTMQVGIVGFGGLQVISARLAPDLIGVYEIQIAIPNNAPTGNNIPIAVAVVPAGSSSSTPGVSSTTVQIPIGQ
jgi:uncharacterized protein (TIGR03437 family)